MRPDYEFTYDGDRVTASFVLAGEEPYPVITGVKLDGPKVYNGHIHGEGDSPMGRTEVCFPNVVGSVAIDGNEVCDRMPVEMRGGFGGLWYAPTPMAVG